MSFKQNFSLRHYLDIFLTAVNQHFHITIRKINFLKLDHTPVRCIIIRKMKITAF